MKGEDNRIKRLRTDQIAKRHWPRLDEYEDVDSRWDHAVELWDVIRPAWWPIFITGLLCFLVVGNDQIKDVLAAMTLEHSELESGASSSAGVSGRYWTTLAACAVYAFIAWAFARGLLSIRFPYTPCPFDPPDWHVVVRMAVARLLGIALPVSCVFSYMSMGMHREAFFYAILAFILLLIFLISRRYIHDWIEEQHERDEMEAHARETGEELPEEERASAARAEAFGDIDDALEEAEGVLDEASKTRDAAQQRRLLDRVALLAEQAGNAVRAAGDEFREADLFDRTMPSSFSRQMRILLYGILLFHAVAGVLFFLFPVSLPQMVGAAAILFLAIAGWLAFGTFVFCYFTRFSKLPPAIFLFTVWLMVASQFNDNHAIARLDEADTPEFEAPQIDAYIKTWLDARKAYLPTREDDPEFPILVIAAEGGGARAAYWTGSVLSDLNAAAPASGLAARDHIFMISGVSGGAVGTATYGAALVSADPAGNDISEPVETFLTQDFLSPVTAGALYHDFFTDWVPFPLAAFDRSRWLEGAWEDGWRRSTGNSVFEEDFRRLWDENLGRQALGQIGAVPLLTFNTTSVRSGSNWAVSPVRYADTPGCDSRDFIDLIDADGRGLPLSAAAHLSARFTGISPAGRIELSGYDDCPANGFDRFVDGAYFENSGADVPVQVVRRLEDMLENYCREQDIDGPVCLTKRMPIIPVAIIAEPPEPSNPPEVSHETGSILMTVANTRIARGQDSLERLETVAHGVIEKVELAIRWAREDEVLGCAQDIPDLAIMTSWDGNSEAHTWRSVPLGWTLSQAAVDHMCRQRVSSDTLARLKMRLEGGLSGPAFLFPER